MFIAARFHANIIALLLGIGVMPIIYSEKTTKMLRDIQLDKILVNIDDIYFQYNDKTINASLLNTIDIESVEKEAINQFSKLSEFLENKTVFLEEV